MSHWGDSSDDWNESFSEVSFGSDISSSDIFQGDHSHPPGGQSAGGDPFNTVLTSSTAYSANNVSSILSVDSTRNEWMSYPGSTGSVSGSFSALNEAGNYTSSASPSVIDSILAHFARHLPSTLPPALPIWQTTSSSSPTSYETTGSDETDSCSSESGAQPANRTLETPATSDASLEADLLLATDQDQDEVVAIPNELLLAGLELRGE
jgi:hypothetical protein